jgi:methionyl-tRNA synthetase
MIQMESKKKFYVTTPIYYANSEPHVGSAYTTIAADLVARWHRLLGEDVFFLTGTDEHGQKIQELAEKNKIRPQQYVDTMAGKFKEAFSLLNINNDNFVRTTDEVHIKEVQKILQQLFDKGLIYKGVYDSFYCVGCEQYLNKSDLEDGKCPLHKKEPEIIKEDSYLFKLSAFQNQLLDVIEKDDYKILPITRKNEILSFIRNGLEDISISRKKSKVSWGIELPFDNNYTCYVWVDAFWNYITGLKEKNAFDKFWPPDVQFMANDIIRVHATIWPALLMATENELPKTLFVHGYFTIGGQKMSKSLGNAVSPVFLSEKYGSDSLRYFLLRDIQFGQDGDFSEESLKERVNNELGANFGNLFYRVTSFIENNFECIPAPVNPGEAEKHIEAKMKETVSAVETLMNELKLTEALKEIMALSGETNKYFQEKEPWKKIKTDNNDCQTTLFYSVNSLKTIAILLYPFVPKISERALKLLDLSLITKEIMPFMIDGAEPENKLPFNPSKLWKDAGKLSLKPGSKVFSEILVNKLE